MLQVAISQFLPLDEKKKKKQNTFYINMADRQYEGFNKSQHEQDKINNAKLRDQATTLIKKHVPTNAGAGTPPPMDQARIDRIRRQTEENRKKQTGGA